jgi:serine phosphatase RsbU (regulator of sigma subunit)/pSer/pThr/pTyr-binding forkhead associated (FHA) protein
MASLVIIKGPNPGRRFPLAGDCTLIGRQPDAAVYLESLAVSRHHARIVHDKGGYVIEDLRSSNRTWVNGTAIDKPVLLTERDEVQIGPYVLGLRLDQPSEAEQVIRARLSAVASNQLFAHNPAYKLQVVLEIAQQLGCTLEIDPLLGRLLEQLLKLFPQADRGMVLLCEKAPLSSSFAEGDGTRLVVRAQRTRYQGNGGDYPYSRSIVKRTLDEGVAILSEDVGGDRNLVLTQTLVSLNLRSFLCVPLIGWEGRRLGVLQLDCLRQGQAFRPEDLEVLTAIGLQVATVLQNAAFHAEQIREERLRQELLLAREIQQAFLPTNFEVFDGTGAELFARVHPAREVSGDLYDFFRLPDGRVVFFLGDVSGKGMPAALFMIAVHTLSRHLAPSAGGPADLLRRLHTALVADNPTHLYVTMACGVYDARDGSVLLAAGGHPPPLLRHPDGRVEVVPLRAGVMLGFSALELRVNDTRLALQPGETLILYTDGFTEAFAPDGVTMFGVDKLREVLGGARTALPLQDCAEEASVIVQRFTQVDELQDDQTLLLLRRRAAAPSPAATS